MTAHAFLKAAFDRPGLLLALALSAPNRIQSQSRVLVEISEAGVLVREPFHRRGRRPNRAIVLGSKETIAAAILLYTIWRERGGTEYEQQLSARVLEYAASTAQWRTTASKIGLAGLRATDRNWIHRDLFASLDIGEDYIDSVEERCREAFRTLEDDGLIVDPGFLTPELVLLFGLIPMQWSVRTPQGEKVYRRIRINAPLWTLEIDRRRNRRAKTDWAFEFRGLAFVRNLMRMAAEQYLAAEDTSRREHGRPRLRPPSELVLDPVVDDEREQ